MPSYKAMKVMNIGAKNSWLHKRILNHQRLNWKMLGSPVDREMKTINSVGEKGKFHAMNELEIN